MDADNITLTYYNRKAEAYVKDTRDVDFSAIQKKFASLLMNGSDQDLNLNADSPERTKGRILDLGCGSGRDSKAFLEMGFDVVPIDGSQKLAELAARYLNRPVTCATFQEYEPEGMFDGIWACATLLHLSYDDIRMVMKKYTSVLKDGGYFYASFKYGTFSGERNGRFFTDLDEQSFARILKEIPQLKIARTFITEDVRPGRASEMWLNVFLVKGE